LRLWQSPLWGIGKVIALEHPELWGGMVDLDPSPAPGEFGAMLDEIQRPDGEDLVALRGQQRFAARLVPSDSQPEYQLPVAGDGSYLITGGCGAFGLQAAAWLVNRGARHLLLVGRRGASTSEVGQAIAGLEQAGAEVWVEAADVSDEKSMRRVLSRLTENGRRLRGVIHAAGLPGYRPLAELDDATLRESFSAKVAGTWILHCVTEPFDLDFFVGCSSMVSVWGAKGQGHYVAGNHFLDVYAHFRRGLGRHGERQLGTTWWRHVAAGRRRGPQTARSVDFPSGSGGCRVGTFAANGADPDRVGGHRLALVQECLRGPAPTALVRIGWILPRRTPPAAPGT
jgi:hypothetical protein